MITKRERFPIGEWSRQVKDKGNALLQTNESIQNIQSEIDITSDSYEKLKGGTAVQRLLGGLGVWGHAT